MKRKFTGRKQRKWPLNRKKKFIYKQNKGQILKLYREYPSIPAYPKVKNPTTHPAEEKCTCLHIAGGSVKQCNMYSGDI